MIEITIIALIAIFFADLSGFPEDFLKPLIKKILKINRNTQIKIKPFDCSLCLVFWSTTIYILAAGIFTLPNLIYCVALSFFANTISQAIKLIKTIIEKFIFIIDNKLIN